MHTAELAIAQSANANRKAGCECILRCLLEMRFAMVTEHDGIVARREIHGLSAKTEPAKVDNNGDCEKTDETQHVALRAKEEWK